MKRFILLSCITVLVFMTIPCYATIVELGGGSADSSGFSYTPVTKTDSELVGSTETDTVVWIPASGKKIVLNGIKFNSDTATTLLVENGTIAVIPTTECTASGQIVIASATPIWQGSADETLTYTVAISGRHSILLYGYEK